MTARGLRMNVHVAARYAGRCVTLGCLTWVLGTCSESSVGPPAVQTPAQIVANSGDRQSAPAGTAVPIAPSVLVTDSGGHPVTGVVVTFAVASGGGSITGSTATTNAGGIATVGSWTLGSIASVHNILAASAANLSGSPVMFRATGLPSAPSKTWTGTSSTDWLDGNNWMPAGVPTATDDVLIPAAPANQPVLDGSGIVNFLSIEGNGARLTLSGGFTFFTLGNMTVTGSGAGLVLSGQTATVEGDFTIGSGALLTMAAPGGALAVQGDAKFSGGDETGLLTTGTLLVAGAFVQTSGTSSHSFVATGTRTILNGPGPQVVSFQDPGLHSSYLGDLTILSPAVVSLASTVVASGTVGVSGNGAALIMNGHTLAVEGNFALSGGSSTLTMTRAQDSLLVSGAVLFDGGDETGKLTNGVVSVGRDFNQNRSASALSYAASGSHKTVLAGTVLQTVTFGGGSGLFPSHFADLEIAGSGGAVVAPFGDGGFVVLGRVSLTTPTTLSGGGFLTVNGRLSAVAGSTIGVDVLTINGDSLTVLATYGVHTTFLIGMGMHIPSLSYRTLIVKGSGSTNAPLAADTLSIGSLTLGGPATVSGSVGVSLGDTLRLNGHTLTVGGDLATEGNEFMGDRSGVLLMRSAAESVRVAGSVFCTGKCDLAAGVLTVGGDLNGAFHLSFGAFAASGTHKTVLNGSGTQHILFMDGKNSLQDLDITDAVGGVDQQGGVVVKGMLTATSTVVRTITGNGLPLVVGAVNVTRLTLDHVLFSVNASTNTPLKLDNVVFQNYAPADTQFTIVHPGAATSFTFNNLTFSTAPTTGLYVLGEDRDGVAPILSVTIVTSGTPSAAQGQLLTKTDGIALVRWQ